MLRKRYIGKHKALILGCTYASFIMRFIYMTIERLSIYKKSISFMKCKF